MKYQKIKILSLVLALLVAINCVFDPLSVKAQAENVYSKKVVDGIEYTLSTYEENGETHVVIRQSNTSDYVDLSVNSQKTKLVKEEYDYVGKSFWGNKKYDSSKETITLDNTKQTDDAVQAFGTNWNSKNYEKWEHDYWYRKGNDGKKVYYQIGCKAKYQIRVDNSNKNNKACTKYANAIKSCNKHYLVGTSALYGTSFSVGFITGLIVSNAIFPPSVIVDIVLAIIGTGAVGTAVVELVKAYSAYVDVKDYYVDARARGKKI